LQSVAGIVIFDTTLRDGGQMPGVNFTARQKIGLAGRFSRFGIPFLELFPAVSKEEASVTRRLAKELRGRTEIVAVTMLRKDQVRLAMDCGVRYVSLFTSLSDIHLRHKLRITRKGNLDRALETIRLCRGRGLKVFFAGEDSTRADPRYLLEFARSIGPHIEYFMPCDTLGCATPESTRSLFAALRKRAGCRLGFHGHNDFGMATANALAAIGAGAGMLSSTFTGIGERAGNVATEEVLAALRFLRGSEMGYDLGELTGICETVSSYSGIAMHPNKPMVGRNAFAHESGLHVDGVLKEPGTYENFDPALVGQERRIFFGRKSGRNAIRTILERRGLSVDPDRAICLLKTSKRLAGRSFTEDELVEVLR